MWGKRWKITVCYYQHICSDAWRQKWYNLLGIPVFTAKNRTRALRQAKQNCWPFLCSRRCCDWTNTDMITWPWIDCLVLILLQTSYGERLAATRDIQQYIHRREHEWTGQPSTAVGKWHYCDRTVSGPDSPALLSVSDTTVIILLVDRTAQHCCR